MYKAKTIFSADVIYQGNSLEDCLVKVREHCIFADNIIIYKDNLGAIAECTPHDLDTFIFKLF
jgi:hypothetical protein